MAIRVFASNSNPAIERYLLKKSLSYCAAEVAAGRARQLDPSNISKGIQLIPAVRRPHIIDLRGSPEAHGMVNAHESQLNASYRRRKTDDFDDAIAEGRAVPLPITEVPILAIEYERRLETHIAAGNKGTPRICASIAARVKTLLSEPAQARAHLIVQFRGAKA